MVDSPQQLGLAISLREETLFTNFVMSAERNREPLSYLSVLSTQGEQDPCGRTILLWGGEGAGLSHLLQATCHSFVARGLNVQYLPLTELIGYPAHEICDGLEYCDLVCIDDIDLVSGRAEWQRSLFDLYNRMRDLDKHFIFTSHSSPSTLPIELPDLRSRLLSGTAFQIHPLDDVGLKQAFIQRATERGLEISEDVANFIFLRAPRSTKFAFNFLEKLDALSLAEQRKITIPFVRQVLDLHD